MFLFFNKINKLAVSGAMGRTIAVFVYTLLSSPIKGMLFAFVSAFPP